MSEDPIIEMVQRASEACIRKYGGMDGWIKHLQAMDHERARKARQRRANKTVSRSPKNGRARKLKMTKV